jgi:hypothetical protein
MRLNADNLFMLRVFLNCERTSFGLSCGYCIYMAKAVLEYFVRRVVTARQQQYVPIVRTPRTPSESAVLTTNRVNAIIISRDCN